MPEFRLEPPPEPAERGSPRWKEWRLTMAENAAMKAAVRSVRPFGKAVENICRSIDINTRRARRKPASRSIDGDSNAFVVDQIELGARRPRLSHRVWAHVLRRAGKGTGTLDCGVRELARQLGLRDAHVVEAVGELVAMNALIRREAWPDGPDFVVNAYVLTEGGGLTLVMDQAEHGRLRPLPPRPGRAESE